MVWLFSMVLGHSRLLWCCFVLHQDLPTLLAFARHYGYLPKATKPYRAKAKGKVERRFVTSVRTSSSAETFATLTICVSAGRIIPTCAG